MKKITLTVAMAMGLVGAASAGVIFDAATDNTTVVHNNGAGTVAGTPGALTYSTTSTSFNHGGFASTDSINTMIGGAGLTDADTVTIQLSVAGITGDAIRANGVFFGMTAETSSLLGGATNESMIVQMEASNNGGDVLVTDTSFQDTGDTGLQTFQNAILLGFDATLTADKDGYEFLLYGVHTTSPLTISGTFSGTEFVDYFGEGHFYYSAQKYNSGVPMVSSITEASISVIPEPATLGMVAATGLGILFIRRRLML